jgi:phosphoribosylanthranilate isomerase
MKVKVCGMKDPRNIRQLAALPVDMIGFIFHEGSPRYAGALTASDTGAIPPSILKVGVFVDERAGAIREKIQQHGLHAVQLHGSEPPALCRELREGGTRVIKALPVVRAADLSDATVPYEGACDYLLFDTSAPSPGGSGKRFDWSLLPAYRGATPFLLAGGIGPGDAPAILALRHPSLYAIDINSRFETAPGVKAIPAIKQFLTTLYPPVP